MTTIHKGERRGIWARKVWHLSVEMDGDVKGYAYVHKAGCRDMRDEYPIGTVTTMEGLGSVIYAEIGWEHDGEDYPYICPCARKAFKVAR